MTKTLDSTAVYAYTTLISMIICVPIALVMEGGALSAGAAVRGRLCFVGQEGVGGRGGAVVHNFFRQQNSSELNAQLRSAHHI